MKVILLIFYLNVLTAGVVFCLGNQTIPRTGLRSSSKSFKYPYLASLQIATLTMRLKVVDYFHICSGTIISNSWIITSTNCINLLSNHFRVVVGVLSAMLSDVFESQFRTPVSIINYPLDGVEGIFEYVSLIKVNKPLVWTPFVQPIAFPVLESREDGIGITVGWNHNTPFEGIFRSKLMYNEIDMIDEKVCYSAMKQMAINRYINKNTTSHIVCGYNLNMPNCFYDFGSALVQDNFLIGIVSSTKICNRNSFPVIYTKIRSIHSWMKTQIKI